MTRIRKAKKIVDGIPENVKMGERKEENWAQYKKDQENLKDRDEFNITSLMGKKYFSIAYYNPCSRCFYMNICMMLKILHLTC